MPKRSSLLRVGLVYVIALGVGAAWFFAGPDTRWLWLDGLIADVLATMVIFTASRLHRNSSFYDAYWSVLPPLLVAAWWVEADRTGVAGDPVRIGLLLAVVGLWAVRLTGNWVFAFPGLHHEDWRYAIFRDRAGRFAIVADLVAIHLIPTLQVFLGLLPAYVVVTRGDRPVGWLDAAAVIVGLVAIALEAVADLQMHRFVRARQPGAVMDRGLWAWSRHPNYLGELGFWISVALFGMAAAPTTWWMWAGVVAMAAMFYGASIPMMERRSLERRPEYHRVIETVPRLWPRPPRRHASLR